MNENHELSKSMKWLFGVPNAIMNLTYNVSGSYFSFFITDVCLLSTVTLGTVASAGGIITLIAIFLWSAIFQYSNTKMGRYRPWILLCSLFVFIGYTAMYANWGVNEAVWGVILIIASAFVYIGITGIIVGKYGLTTKIASTATDRSEVVSKSILLFIIARVISAAIVLPIVIFIGGSKTAPSGYFIYFAGFAFLQLLSHVVFNKYMKPYDAYDPAFKEEGNSASLKDIMSVLGKNRKLSAFFVADTAMQLLGMVKAFVMIYFCIYVLGDVAFYVFYTTASPLLSTAASAAVASISKKIDKYVIITVCTIGVITPCLAIGAIGYLSGWTINPYLFLGLGFMSSFFDGAQRSIQPACYMDLAEVSYNKTGKDITPVVMGIQSLPFQFAFGGGSLALLSFILAQVGYVANAPQTASAITGLFATVSIVPAIGYALFLLMFRTVYKLDKKTVDKIYADNATKREEIKIRVAASKQGAESQPAVSDIPITQE